MRDLFCVCLSFISEGGACAVHLEEVIILALAISLTEWELIWAINETQPRGRNDAKNLRTAIVQSTAADYYL